jgi:hypothetical protein
LPVSVRLDLFQNSFVCLISKTLFSFHSKIRALVSLHFYIKKNLLAFFLSCSVFKVQIPANLPICGPME